MWLRTWWEIIYAQLAHSSPPSLIQALSQLLRRHYSSINVHKGLHNHYVSRWYYLTCGELVGIPRRAAFSEDDGYDRYQSKSSMLHQTSSPKPTKRKYQKEYNGFTPNQGDTMEEKTTNLQTKLCKDKYTIQDNFI